MLRYCGFALRCCCRQVSSLCFGGVSGRLVGRSCDCSVSGSGMVGITSYALIVIRSYVIVRIYCDIIRILFCVNVYVVGFWSITVPIHSQVDYDSERIDINICLEF